MPTFREKVISCYAQSVAAKIEALQKQQEDMLESLKGETKSTVGDKYETSRAMLHLEQDKLASQLSVLLQHKALLDSIVANSNVPKGSGIQPGSIAETDKGFIFIAAALGKMSVDNRHVFAVSPESPLGKLLIGKNVDESVSVQSVTYTIKAVL